MAALALLGEDVCDAGVLPLGVGLPAGSRLQRMLDVLSQRPDDRASAAEWAQRLGMSERTLARLARQDTGSSFGAWHRRARLLVALERLAGGVPVARIAAELGYASDSAFIYMFRRTLGVTPQRYFEELPPAAEAAGSM